MDRENSSNGGRHCTRRGNRQAAAESSRSVIALQGVGGRGRSQSGELGMCTRGGESGRRQRQGRIQDRPISVSDEVRTS